MTPQLASFLLTGDCQTSRGQAVVMNELFCCESCGSPAVTYPRELHGRSRVVCAGCGGLIGTLGELRARAERLLRVARLSRPAAAHDLLNRL